MKQNILLCNKCAVTYCSRWRRSQRGENTCLDLDTNNCESFLPFDNFTQPILIHLLTEDKVQNTIQILEEYGFEVRETGRAPFFKLALSTKGWLWQKK